MAIGSKRGASLIAGPLVCEESGIRSSNSVPITSGSAPPKMAANGMATRQASITAARNTNRVVDCTVGDASTKVMAACDALGGIATHYSINDSDAILDLLEGIVDREDITENDVAHFIRSNATRFDEDVMYLLGTRFPILEDEE